MVSQMRLVVPEEKKNRCSGLQVAPDLNYHVARYGAYGGDAVYLTLCTGTEGQCKKLHPYRPCACGRIEPVDKRESSRPTCRVCMAAKFAADKAARKKEHETKHALAQVHRAQRNERLAVRVKKFLDNNAWRVSDVVRGDVGGTKQSRDDISKLILSYALPPMELLEESKPHWPYRHVPS